MSIDQDLTLLKQARSALIKYLDNVVRPREDWHGVMDAAADLREVESKIEGIEEALDYA